MMKKDTTCQNSLFPIGNRIAYYCAEKALNLVPELGRFDRCRAAFALEHWDYK